MRFRFLHLADLHLETCFGGSESTRKALRRATLDAFDRALEFAEEQELHAVLVAGDLFDDRILSPKVGWRIVERVQRLTESGCWFLYCCGNHDPGNAAHHAAKLGLEADGDPEDWQRRVHLFRGSVPQRVEVTDRDGVAVGLVIGAGHVTDAESKNLCAKFPARRELAAQARELPLVGLLHTQVENAGSATEHARYAPSTREDYERCDYDYWAIGHVHVRQRALDGLPVWYPGNLQGRNPKETGPKGGLLVEATAGFPAEPEFQSFATVRWERIELDDLAGVDTIVGLVRRLSGAVSERARGGEEFAARLVLRGPCRLAGDLRDPEKLEGLGEEIAERSGALEIQLRLEGLYPPVDVESLRGSRTVMAQALELIASMREDAALLERLAPDDLAGEDDRDRGAYLASLLEGLEAELIERFAVPEDPS